MYGCFALETSKISRTKIIIKIFVFIVLNMWKRLFNAPKSVHQSGAAKSEIRLFEYCSKKDLTENLTDG